MTNKKLKILAFSDTHGDKKLLDDHIKTAERENVDLIIIGGDFTSPSEDVPQNIVGPFLKLGKRVMLLHGNHDDESVVKFLAERYKVRNLHNYSVIYDDVAIFGSGGATIGPFPTSDIEIFESIKKGHKYVKNAKKKVMVTHNHPSKSLMEKFSQIVPGSNAVRKAIDEFQPDILLCGHVHEAEGVEEIIGKTKVINIAKTGKVFEI